MPISREAAGTESLRESIRRMEHGFLVGIFPEGTRSDDGALGELKPGFLALVRRAGVPVIPVGVAGPMRPTRAASGSRVPAAFESSMVHRWSPSGCRAVSEGARS